VKGRLYFSAETEEHGRELYWVSRHGGKPKLLDLNPGEASSDPSDLAAIGGSLYFTAFDEDSGRELYRLSPGSRTPQLVDVAPGPDGSAPQDYFVL
jgi:ELWxxDGT repeat protein